jgi:hypothetical protein
VSKNTGPGSMFKQFDAGIGRSRRAVLASLEDSDYIGTVDFGARCLTSSPASDTEMAQLTSP